MATTDAPLLRTALYETHKRLGATFVPFAGHEMPVHYGSIKDEHAAVRTAVGLFDVSHMGNLWVAGPGAAAALARVTPTDPTALPVGKGKYTVVLREDGTILDDTIYFRLGEERYYMVPNAGRGLDVAAHIQAHGSAFVEDVGSQTSILALQGPKARDVLARAAGQPAHPKFHHMGEAVVGDVHCMVSGTGYTGEKGVELYLPAQGSQAVWDALMEAGKVDGIRAVGLGARDTLRLEKGYCLAGNEFAGGRTPLEAGLEWTMDWSGDFLGKDLLLRQREEGHDRLVGLRMRQGIPRAGYPVRAGGPTVGTVTSGTMSPTLNVGIALAYLRGVADGADVEVLVRDRPHPATVVKPPFV